MDGAYFISVGLCMAYLNDWDLCFTAGDHGIEFPASTHDLSWK